jgi:anti-sigma factor RsiW
VNCDETHQLIHGYVDDELDLVRSLEVEQHLRDCTACAQTHQRLQALRDSLRAGSLYQRPSAQLKQRIQSALRQARGAKRQRRAAPWRGLAIAASIAAAVFLTWGAVGFLSARFAEDRLIRDVLASHARSVLAVHKVDEISSDRHVVKPWLNEKLGFSPDVADRIDPEFPLVGARLDYLDDQPVAALVYMHGKHLINLFVWPLARDAEAGLKATSSRGYHLYHWTKQGMNYWVVSDLNEEKLQQFVRQIRD